MKKAAVLLLLLAFAVGLKAQKKQLFDGGMMVHTGYIIDNISALDYKASGMSPDFVIGTPKNFRQRVFQWVCAVS